MPHPLLPPRGIFVPTMMVYPPLCGPHLDPAARVALAEELDREDRFYGAAAGMTGRSGMEYRSRLYLCLRPAWRRVLRALRPPGYGPAQRDSRRWILRSKPVISTHLRG